MTTPFKIYCKGSWDIPTLSELKDLLRSNNHVVLQFPGQLSADEQRAIRDLTDTLSDCSVFNGSPGSGSITVKPIIGYAKVLAHTHEITRAVFAYIRICTSLQRRYADGILSPDWSADEHGEYCLFKNVVTGQLVEAPFADPILPQHVDPYFFALYVKTTPDCITVAALIQDDFHDAARILEILFPKNDAQANP